MGKNERFDFSGVKWPFHMVVEEDIAKDAIKIFGFGLQGLVKDIISPYQAKGPNSQKDHQGDSCKAHSKY